MPLPPLPDDEILSPEDQQSQLNAKFARDYIKRDISAEAKKAHQDALPKNKFLRALVGMGEGAARYYDPKKDFEKNTYDKLEKEYATHAPILQRDLSAWEATQQRLLSKREETKQRADAEDNKFYLKEEELRIKNNLTKAQMSELKSRAGLNDSRAGKFDADTKGKLLENTILQTTGAKAGTMSGEGANAVAAGKDPVIKQSLEDAANSNAKRKASLEWFKSIVNPKGSGTGAQTSTRETVLKKQDGSAVIQPLRTFKSGSGGGGKPPMDISQAGAAIQQLFGGGGAGTPSPFGPGQPPNAIPGPAPTGIRTPSFTPPSAAPALKQLLTPPGTKPTAKVDSLGRPILDDTVKKPTAGQQEAAALHGTIVKNIDMTLDALSGPLKSKLIERMGPAGGSTVLATKRRWFNDDGSPEDRAESRVLQNAASNTWKTILENSGKTLSGPEVKLANAMTVNTNLAGNGVTDPAWKVTYKLIGQRIMLQANNHWKQIYDSTDGPDSVKRAAADSQNISAETMADHTEYLYNRWKQNHKLSAEDFDLGKISPATHGSASTKVFHGYTEWQKSKGKKPGVN